jgi:hypothetical protein
MNEIVAERVVEAQKIKGDKSSGYRPLFIFQHIL